MKKLITIAALIVFVSRGSFSQTVIFQETFESGTASSTWGVYYNGEETVVAKPMSAAPKALAGGGSYVGLLQDANGSYTGSAVAVNGAVTLKDYSIEADVYCYQNQALSAYSGLVVYADSSKKDFYKMRVDFDANDRINFSGLKSDPNTFLPLFSNDFKGVNYAGGYPKTDGWHKLKVEVRTISATQVSIWCYFDNVLLQGSPISYTNANAVTAGRFGLYSFQQSATGLATYFDNIVVTTLVPTSVKNENVLPATFALEQNYPNPFNPATQIGYSLPSSASVSLAIYDPLGREVISLVSSEQTAGEHSVVWNGKDSFGSDVPSGIYFYTLRSGNNVSTKKMIFMK